MTTSSPSNTEGRRRPEVMKFAYSGPFASRSLDPRVGRTLPLTEERYIPTSPEVYSIGTRLGAEVVRELTSRFGREANSAPKRSRGGRRRRNRSTPKVQA